MHPILSSSLCSLYSCLLLSWTAILQILLNVSSCSLFIGLWYAIGYEVVRRIQVQLLFQNLLLLATIRKQLNFPLVSIIQPIGSACEETFFIM